MNTAIDKVRALNSALKKLGTIGKQEDKLFLFEGNLILNGKTLVAKTCDDGLLVGITGGKLQAEAIKVLNLLDGVEVILQNKMLFLNRQPWSGELSYVDQTDGSWKYRIE